MRRILVVAVAVILVAAPVRASDIVLTSEQRTDSMYEWLTCAHEDTWWQRNYSGSLSGTFTVDVPMCFSEDIPGGPGGEAIRVAASGRGSRWSVRLVSPSGVVTSATVDESVTRGSWFAYSLCRTPDYVDPVTGAMGGLLEPGLWRVIVEGTSRDLGFAVETNMAHLSWQAAACPLAHRSATS